MHFNVPHPTEARERKMYPESFQMMQTQLDQMNARLNGCSNTKVGNSNFPNSKALSGVQIGMDHQSPQLMEKQRFKA